MAFQAGFRLDNTAMTEAIVDDVVKALGEDCDLIEGQQRNFALGPNLRAAATTRDWGLNQTRFLLQWRRAAQAAGN